MSTPQPPRGQAVVPAPGPYVEVLVGRDQELGRLDEAFARVSERGTALVLTGEPGIGKSSLLDAAVTTAGASGFQVLRATGVEAEEGLAFAGLQLLLGPVMSARKTLPQVQRAALGTALGLEDGPPPQPFLVGLATLNLLSEAAARRPVAVVADDVQWLDAPTQEVLAFLARRVAGDPVVLAAAIRTGHPSPLLGAGADLLRLRGLDEDAAREVLTGAAGDLADHDRAAILEQARGNPLALVELPTTWRSAGTSGGLPVAPPFLLTERLERAFAARLQELPTLTREALLVAATDAEEELPEILAAASTLAGTALDARVLEPAVQAGLLTFDPARVRFRHPLVKSGILQAEPVSRRQAASTALADALRDQPLRRTWYRAQATVGPDDEVADELEAAHTDNLRRGAVTAAIRSLERAAQLTRTSPRRGHRLLLAAELAYGLGQVDLVARLLAEASGQSLVDLDRSRLAWLQELPDDTDLRNPRRIHDLCDAAVRASGPEPDLALDLLVAAAVRCHWGWPASDVRDRVVAVTRSLRAAETDPRYVAALAVAQPLLQSREVAELLSRAGSGGEAGAEGLALYGMAAFAVGDQLRAADFLARAEARCRSEGRLGLLAQVLALRSAVAMDLGDWRDAASASDEARRLASETRQSTWRAGTLSTIARRHALQGDAALALELAAELENTVAARGNTCSRASVVLVRGFAALQAGRHLEAYAQLRRLFDPDDPCCHERERMPGVMFLAEAAVLAGRQEDARSVLAALEETADQVPSPLLHAHLGYARPVLAGDADAERLYVEALATDLTRWPLVRARLELAHGSWLRRRRRPTEARAPLRSAQDTLEWVGADRWAAQARAELRAAGDRTAAGDGSRRPPGWQDRLTGQELQIARLAAEGLTNRGIGERLFMSHRTVGAHLRHIFPKLEITSRVQLAQLVGPRG